MFGLFKKKILKTEEEKRAESLPRTKKVQFEPMKVAEAEQLLDADIRAVLGFSPVNYYATMPYLRLLCSLECIVRGFPDRLHLRRELLYGTTTEVHLLPPVPADSHTPLFHHKTMLLFS